MINENVDITKGKNKNFTFMWHSTSYDHEHI